MTSTSSVVSPATHAVIAAISGPLASEFHPVLAGAWENRVVNHHRTDLPDDILSKALEDAFNDLLNSGNPTVEDLVAPMTLSDIDWETVAAEVKGQPNDFL